jgi:hypothetical protein
MLPPCPHTFPQANLGQMALSQGSIIAIRPLCSVLPQPLYSSTVYVPSRVKRREKGTVSSLEIDRRWSRPGRAYLSYIYLLLTDVLYFACAFSDDAG